MLAQGVKMGPCRTELRICQRNFAAPLRIGQFEQRMWSGGELHKIRVDEHSTAAIPESRPTVRFAKDVLSGHLARSHLFVSPKNIALRMAAFGQQPIGQTDGFY